MSLALITLTVGAGGFGLLRLRELNGSASRMAARHAKVATAMQGVELIGENARVSMHLFLVGDPLEFDRQVAAQQQRSGEITALYETIAREFDEDAERTRFARIQGARAGYTHARSLAEMTLRQGHVAKAQAEFESTVHPLLDTYFASWNDLLAFEGVRMDEAAREAAMVYARARGWTAALIAMAAATGLFLAIVMTRQITKPIQAIAAAARKLEKGELTRVTTFSGGEIGDLARGFNLMGEAVAFRQQRLEREMTLAQNIQNALLPKNVVVPALELSAGIEPATEVGGDYYDILPTRDGCWFGMGDVAGHGLDAGLVMLMLQSAVTTLVRATPDAAPRSLVCAVNGVLYHNIRERMDKTMHATLVLLRFKDDGEVVFAGAHEDILVCRAKERRCEAIETVGTWVGGVATIEAATVDSRLRLDVDDLLVLFTDGFTEARNVEGALFGLDRLCREVERVCDQPVQEVRDHLFRAVHTWAHEIDDDLSLLIARRRVSAPVART
jgi:serine phosphatase RsbU (regulator of sigma subunit)